jgi:hypothetical protein
MQSMHRSAVDVDPIHMTALLIPERALPKLGRRFADELDHWTRLCGIQPA